MKTKLFIKPLVIALALAASGNETSGGSTSHPRGSTARGAARDRSQPLTANNGANAHGSYHDPEPPTHGTEQEHTIA